MKSRTVALILIAGALAVGGILAADGLMRETLLRPTQTAPGTAAIGGPFALIAPNGQTVSDQTYRGKWVLLYFGYTYCPDACPTALNNISVALDKLGSNAGKLQPLFVTVDPQRDTRDAMTEYLKSFDSRILGLTGTKDQIDSVVREFHLYVSPDKSDGEDNYLVSHSSYIYLMDPRGIFVDVIQGGAVGDEIAAWLRREMTHAAT
jgi:protein SCO1/2